MIHNDSFPWCESSMDPHCLVDMSNCHFIGLAYQGKDAVFRFIIEYSSLMDFGLQVIGLFLLYEDFWNMIFWLVLKVDITVP
jgi:hypothetical protein